MREADHSLRAGAPTVARLLMGREEGMELLRCPNRDPHHEPVQLVPLIDVTKLHAAAAAADAAVCFV